MTQLPRALAPWARYLALFPEELALSLGAILPQLSLLLSSAGRSKAMGTGEPDGYDGLSRHGSYERLLLTEWALSEEVPDEFLRRALSSEHVFLSLARQEFSGEKQCIAMFDPGPDQLGAPRVVHLAALLLLAQRAEGLGAGFRWGILGRSHEGLHDSVTESSILRLLSARSARPISGEDITRCKELVLPTSPVMPSLELWMIGGRRLSKLLDNPSAFLLEAKEDLNPVQGPARVRLEVKSPMAPPRTALLELPPAHVCVRLLRDPFRAVQAPRMRPSVRIARDTSFVFSADGRKVFARGDDGTLVTLVIPNSPKAPPALPCVFAPPEHHVIVGVGQAWSRKRRTIVLTQRDQSLFWHVLSKRSTVFHKSVELDCKSVLPLEPASASSPLSCLCLANWALGVFPDQAGRLLKLDKTRVTLLDKRTVLAVKPSGFTQCWVAREGFGPWQFHRAQQDPHGELIVTDHLPCECTPQPIRVLMAGHSIPVVAFSDQGLDWHVWISEGTEPPNAYTSSLSTRPGDDVVGVVLERNIVGKLLVVDGSRRKVEILRDKGAETLLTTSDPILRAHASNVSGIFACLTETGELVVYSLEAGAVVFRMAGETYAYANVPSE